MDSLTRSLLVAGVFVALFATCANGQSRASANSDDCKPVVNPSKFFFAKDRLGLDVSAPLKGGELNELTLVLHGPPISCINIWQTNTMGEPITETAAMVPVLRRSDGSQYVPFTPVLLGKVGVHLSAIFPDGGFSRLGSIIDVEPSDREPALLMIQLGGIPGTDHDMWRLGLKDPEWQSPGNWFHFFSSAYYLDSKWPVMIDRAYLRFAVKQPLDRPVIELSEDGGVRPLRVGDALLETTFGNTTRETCIQVRDDLDGGDNSRCGGLRSPQPDSPLDTVWSHNPDGLESDITGDWYEHFVSRLSVTPPSQPVGLAQPLDIPIEVTGGTIRSFGVGQRMRGSDARVLQSEQAKIVQDNGESKVIEFTPVGFGEETISVGVQFEDQGFDERYFHIKTVPSDGGLQQIRLSLMTPENGRAHIAACLKYTQIANCIFLNSLQGLDVTVTQPGKPVLRVDPDGTLHNLGVGVATVTVRIGSVQQSLQVGVREAQVP